MSRRRLYVPAERLAGARLVLDGDDHQHVARVLRGEAGERLTLFDGEGTEVDAEIVRVGKRDTELTLGARRPGAATAAPVAVTLLVAAPRGERMDLVLQKATELGIARIVPVVTERRWRGRSRRDGGAGKRSRVRRRGSAAGARTCRASRRPSSSRRRSRHPTCPRGASRSGRASAHARCAHGVAEAPAAPVALLAVGPGGGLLRRRDRGRRGGRLRPRHPRPPRPAGRDGRHRGRGARGRSSGRLRLRRNALNLPSFSALPKMGA